MLKVLELGEAAARALTAKSTMSATITMPAARLRSCSGARTHVHYELRESADLTCVPHTLRTGASVA
eukprot:5440242-Prymnesium_polylepis.1